MKTNNWYVLLIAVLTSISTIAAYKIAGFDRSQVVLQEVGNKTSKDDMVQLTKNGKNAKVQAPFDFTEAASKVTPMVVHIVATQEATARSKSRQREDMPDLFREFFGDDFNGSPFRGPQKSQGSGSGVIISQDGYIVTNNHVVENATEIEVILSDKRNYKAELVGTAPSTDLAVIRIKEKGLPAIVFGNSDEIKVGEWVLAVGNPFNLESTVTAGIVSAKARSIDILRQRGADAIESFIQTDAAVNPGNSGGALVNVNGELVGINTAIATPTGTYAGYSFAVPANIVKKVIRDLIEYGSIQRGYLGVNIRQLDGKLAQEKNIKGISEGVYIDNVNENSAAKEAGIKSGDVIVGLDGKRIKSSPELLEEIARRRPGDKVKLEVVREGGNKIIDVYLKGKEGAEVLANREVNDMLRNLGADFEDLSKDEAVELKLKGGVKVTQIRGGKLLRAGIQEGFIITKVNGESVKSVTELTSKLEKLKGQVMLSGVYPDDEGEYSYGFKM
jgi:serine protease Do